MATLSATWVSVVPESTRSVVESSILGRAIKAGHLAVFEESMREHALDKHKSVDDSPCGGGPGQLMKIDVVVRALRSAVEKDQARHPDTSRKVSVILADPSGKPFTQNDAKRLAKQDHLVFVCGRYEGIDARIHHYVDEVFSLGDFIITGGELASLVIFDAISRCVPGVLGNEESAHSESHEDGLLEHGQYTRPLEFEGHRVPEILTGGNHGQIALFRRGEQLLKTQEKRPDLFTQRALSKADEKALKLASSLAPFPWQTR